MSSIKVNNEMNDLLKDVANRLTDYFDKVGESGHPTVILRSPEEIKKQYNDAGLDLSLEDGSPHTSQELSIAVDVTMANSVHTNSPGFHNQLYGRAEAPGIMGQMITSVMGGATHTFEVGPAFTLMELECLNKFKSVVGYPTDGDGILTPGGSLGNMYGIHLARYRRFGDIIKTQGVYNLKPLCIFVSDNSHYSYKKSMSFLGLGTDNCIPVPVDDTGKMIPKALVEAIETAVLQGKEPILIGATAGTTVFGAFDDLVELRTIADRFQMWLHVDACWGGPAIFSSKPEIKALVDGISKTDSLSWNPHKFMSIPQQCTVFLTRHDSILRTCNAGSAAYLFQKDKENSNVDIGDKTVMCGRMPDGCKLWFAWKAIGDQGWTDRIDKAVDLINDMVLYSQRKDVFKGRFKTVIGHNFTNFCFWYLPAHLAHLSPGDLTKESGDWSRVHEVAKQIKRTMQIRGLAMIGFSSVCLNQKPSNPYPNFFRMVLAGVDVLTTEGLYKTLRDIDNIGSELFSCKGICLADTAPGSPN